MEYIQQDECEQAVAEFETVLRADRGYSAAYFHAAGRPWRSWGGSRRPAISTGGASPPRATRTRGANWKRLSLYWANKDLLRRTAFLLAISSMRRAARSSTGAAPVRPPPFRRAPAATPAGQNQLDSNQALFTVLAAINVAGYDEQIDSPSTHAFRHTVRVELDARNLESIGALKRFFRERRLQDQNAELSRYISYALLINGAPDFEYRDPDMVRPPDATSLEGLSPLLAAFYKEARLWTICGSARNASPTQ